MSGPRVLAGLRLLLDGLDIHVLAPDGVAHYLAALDGPLAQGHLAGHARLLRDNRPLAGRSQLDRLFTEGLVGLVGVEAVVLAATLDLDLLLVQRHRLLALAFGDAGDQALAAGNLLLADAQLLLDRLGALHSLAAPEQLLRRLQLEAVHHRESRVSLLGLRSNQDAAPHDCSGVLAGPLHLEAAID